MPKVPALGQAKRCLCRCLPISEEIVDRWGRLMAAQTLPVIDSLLAATALTHDLTVVTRNLADFKRTRVKLLDPFA